MVHNHIAIYQFCRAFNNIHYSNSHKQFVSGGYSHEQITHWNQEVPDEIRQAVLDSCFAINDNYPPAENDFALIAREIGDRYAVLAVANRQLDDSNRPTIGYKYFWLEKTDPEIDGINTLIYWWRNDIKYQFNLEELVSSSAPDIYHAQICNKTNFAEHWLETLRYTVNSFKQIPCTRVVIKEDWEGLPSYIKLHYLAFGLSIRADSLNAWAWNVRKLLSPETFLFIWYSTSADIPTNLYQHQLPSKIITDNNNSNLDNLEIHSPLTNEHENSLPFFTISESTHSFETQNYVPPAPVQRIKICLTELARSFHSRNQLDVNKAKELFGYLANYSYANWSDFIDQTTLNAPANTLSDIYKAEIYLIVDDDKQKWLIDLLKSIHVPNDSLSVWDSLISQVKKLLITPTNNDHIFRVLEFQHQLLKECYKYDFQVQQRLIESIYYGITFFLRSLVNLDPNDPNDERIAQQINYLLTQHQSIWNQYFQEYAYLVATKVFYQPNIDISAYNSVRKFIETILEILENIKNKKLDLGNRKRLYGRWKLLALIFEKINRTDLAELFYRISGSQIPKKLLGKIPP